MRAAKKGPHIVKIHWKKAIAYAVEHHVFQGFERAVLMTDNAVVSKIMRKLINRSLFRTTRAKRFFLILVTVMDGECQ